MSRKWGQPANTSGDDSELETIGLRGSRLGVWSLISYLRGKSLTWLFWVFFLGLVLSPTVMPIFAFCAYLYYLCLPFVLLFALYTLLSYP